MPLQDLNHHQSGQDTGCQDDTAGEYMGSEKVLAPEAQRLITWSPQILWQTSNLVASRKVNTSS